MTELQYLREEIRRLSDSCQKNSSTMITFIVTIWTGIFAFTSWAYETYDNFDLISIVLPAMLFVCSIYVCLSANQQMKYRTDILKMQTYVFFFYKNSNWDQLSFRNQSNEKYKKEFQWIDAEYFVFSLITVLASAVCCLINIWRLNSDIVYIIYSAFIGGFEIVMFIWIVCMKSWKRFKKIKQTQICKCCQLKKEGKRIVGL